MGKVLIVDDDTNFLLSVQEGLKFYLPEVELLTATTGEEALKVMKNKNVDVVVTDLKMPGMSGLELLSALSRNYPQTAVIFITAYGTPRVKTEAERLGAIKYMEKPVELKELADAIKSSLELARQGGRVLSKIPLPLVLEMINIEGSSLTVVVESSGRKGNLHFKNGKLINAETEDTFGLEAFKEIAKFENPVFRMFPLKKSSQIIDKPFEELIRIATEWQTVGHAEKKKATGVSEKPAKRESKVVKVANFTINKVLKSFTALEAFRYACITDSNGEILGELGEKVNLKKVLNFIISNQAALSELFPNGIKMVSLEGSEKILLISRVNGELWIALMVGGEVNLGIARHLLKRASSDLGK